MLRYLKLPANFELLVPAPTIPSAKIALIATSASESYASLFNKSSVLTSGFDTRSKPIASGTVFLIVGSPYYNKWFIVLKHISVPIDSPNAINATPITAAI